MSMFIDILDSFPNPKVLFLDKSGTPLFAFSQSGVETLSSGLFVGDNMLRWEEITRIFIICMRLGKVRMPSIHLVNLDETLHRLSKADSKRLKRRYRSWRGGVSLDLYRAHTIRIDGTPVNMTIEDIYQAEEAFTHVVTRFSPMEVRAINADAPEYESYITAAD